MRLSMPVEQFVKYAQISLLSFITFSHHFQALNICADVPLRNYSLTQSVSHSLSQLSLKFMQQLYRKSY